MSLYRLAVAHLAFTAAMAGVIAVVQLVVYPQYDLVPAEVFSEYVANHGVRIGFPLGMFAPAEVLLALLVWLRLPTGSTKTLALVSGVLLVAIWVTTMVWFGPLHGRLVSEPYDPDTIDLLANTNWFRTLLWWARAGLAVVLLERIASGHREQVEGRTTGGANRWQAGTTP